MIEELFKGAPKEVIDSAIENKKSMDKLRLAEKQAALWARELSDARLLFDLMQRRWGTLLQRYNTETKTLEPDPMVTLESQQTN